jgi:hypothetical protein
VVVPVGDNGVALVANNPEPTTVNLPDGVVVLIPRLPEIISKFPLGLESAKSLPLVKILAVFAFG